MRRRKLYTRIMAAAFSGVAAFAIAAAVFAAVWISWDKKAERGAEADFRAESLTAKIESEIKSSIDRAEALKLSEGVKKFALYGDYSALEEEISSYSAAFDSPYSEVYVSALSDSMGDVYGAQSTMNVFAFLRKIGQSSGSAFSLAEEFGAGEERVVKFYAPTAKSESNCILIIDKSIFSSKPIYFLSVIYTEPLFTAILENSDNVMFFQDGAVRLASANTPSAASAFAEKIMEGARYATEAGGTDSAGRMYLARESRFIDCTYVFARKFASVSEQTAARLVLVISGALAAFAAAAAVCSVLRKRVYAPIDRLIDGLAKYNRDYKSDEAAYISETVEKISDSAMSAADEAAKMKEKLKTESLRDLIRGIKRSENPYEPKGDGPYRAIVLEFAKYSAMEAAFSEKTVDELRHQVIEYINSEIGEYIEDGALIMDYKSFAAVISGMDVRLLRAKLMNVTGAVFGSFEAEMYGAIGDLCEEISLVGASFLSAVKYMENACALGGKNTIVTQEDASAAESGLYYPIETEREIITEVIRCHTEEVRALLDSVLDENLEKGVFTKEKQHSLAGAVASTVNRIISAVNTTLADVYGDEFVTFLEIKMCPEKNEVRKKVHSVFKALTDYISSQSSGSEKDISKELVDYIHAHYSEDISLSDIGENFNLSQTYVSTLFKEATGENFKEYLSRYRIKTAKEILKAEPQIKNDELAGRIGINTVATLLRMFNKYEGMTPAQYAKQARKN